MTVRQTLNLHPSRTDLAIRFTLVVILSMIVVALGMTMATLPYGRAIWDFLFVLDGAYRISLGQVPHVDFASPIGPMTLYLTEASRLLSESTNPFAGLHVLNWLVGVPPLLFLAGRFRSSVSLLAALALLALMMLVPITVDQTQLSEISYFASYNRFASGYLFLLGLWLVFPKHRHDWAFLGYLVLVLFFLKITACAVAIAVIGTATIFSLSSLRLAAATTLFVLIVLGGLELASGGFITAYLADVYEMSRVNAGSGIHNVLYAAYKSWLTILLVTAFLGYLLYTSFREGNPDTPLWRKVTDLLWQDDTLILKATLLMGAALLAESQNSGGIGLISAAALLFHRRIWSGSTAKVVLATSIIASIVVPLGNVAFSRMLTVVIRETRATVAHPVNDMFPGTTVTAQTVTAAKLFKRINQGWPDFVRGLEAEGSGYQLEMDPSSNAPGGMLAWIESAVDAAKIFKDRNYGERSNHYTTIAFADPFARMLGLSPALKTNIVMDIGRTIPTMDEQDAEAYLSGSDGVFFARCERRTLVNNDAAFEVLFQRSFEKFFLNECWDFYRRHENP